MKTLVETVMEDFRRWDSQFAHELIKALKREVEEGGWESLAVWETIREHCNEWKLQPHNPETENLAQAARMFIPGSISRQQLLSDAIRDFDAANESSLPTVADGAGGAERKYGN